MVRPINEELLQNDIRELMKDTIGPNESLHIRCGALAVTSVVISNKDCIYYFMEKRALKDGIYYGYDYICDIPVRTRVKTKDGEACPMLPTYYFPVSKSLLEEKYLLPAISLKEFMGERYDYNPRIKGNMRKLLNDDELIEQLSTELTDSNQ